MPRVIDQSNFHLNTFGVFERCHKTPTTKPIYVSWSGSKYWVDGEYLIRYADHWTHRVASCGWVLNPGQDKQGEWITARIKFSDLCEKPGPEYLKSTRKRKRYRKKVNDRLNLRVRKLAEAA